MHGYTHDKASCQRRLRRIDILIQVAAATKALQSVASARLVRS